MAYYAAGTIIPSKLHLFQAESKQSDIFRLLDLPGEIRNKIYDLAFKECVIDIRMSNQQQYHNEIIDRPFVEYQRQPPKQHCKKPQLESRKSTEKQPRRKFTPTQSKADTQLLKQAPMLQEQPRAVSQKLSKTKQRRRRHCKESPPRMYHNVLSLGPNGDRTATDYRVPFDFLFSSRQIYIEALCVLYAKIVFRFSNTLTLDTFLVITPLRALQAIQGLDIYHATYGEPQLTRDRRFKISADKKWLTTCQQIRDKMINLKNLRLKLQLNEWPIQLGLREDWAQTVLCLRRNGLDRVDATLLHSAFPEDRLKEAARHLETAMMSNEAQIARRAAEKRLLEAKKKKPESKVRKVLVIKMDNIPKPQEVQKGVNSGVI